MKVKIEDFNMIFEMALSNVISNVFRFGYTNQHSDVASLDELMREEIVEVLDIFLVDCESPEFVNVDSIMENIDTKSLTEIVSTGISNLSEVVREAANSIAVNAMETGVTNFNI